jgi:hypothetical protein
MGKYIVFSDGSFIMWSLEGEEHKKMASRFSEIPVSAGQFIITRNKFYCCGESMTLGIKSREEIDSKILNGEK